MQNLPSFLLNIFNENLYKNKMNEDKLKKFCHLFSKISNVEMLPEASLAENIGYMVARRKHKEDSWEYDTTYLDSIYGMLDARLKANQAYLDAMNVYNGDPNHGDPYKCNPYVFGGASIPHEVNDEEFFQKYMEQLNRDELLQFLDSTACHDEFGEDEEYRDSEEEEEEILGDGNMFESLEDDEDYKSCLNEKGLFDVGAFRVLSQATRNKLARNMRRTSRSGKTHAARERNKHRRIVDPLILIRRARQAARRVLIDKYMPNYDEASNNSRNQFNKLIHTSKMSEFIKATKSKYKEIRTRELHKEMKSSDK